MPCYACKREGQAIGVTKISEEQICAVLIPDQHACSRITGSLHMPRCDSVRMYRF
jgi:hypothetical protein